MDALARPNPPGWGLTPIPARVAERAATRFTVDPDSGCHVSTYPPGPGGYAKIGWSEGGKIHNSYVHRAAYVHHSGKQIPAGLTVDHHQAVGCTSRRCIGREHLRLLTKPENSARKGGLDWPTDGTCAHGHGPEHRMSNGRNTWCDLCKRSRRAAGMRRRRAADVAQQGLIQE